MINGVPWIDVDPFIDIERLKSIELDIVKGICRSRHDISFYGRNTIDPYNRPDFLSNALNEADDSIRLAYAEIEQMTSAYMRTNALKIFSKLCFGSYSGGTSVIIRRPMNGYLDKNSKDGCRDTVNTENFSSLMSFIQELPFTEIGRILIFVNDHDLVTPIHLDHVRSKTHRNEFLWFRPNLEKKFFIYNQKDDIKHHVTSHSAFFNEQDWHGTDPSTRMCFSIRVDGVFTNDFRKQLNIDGILNYNA